LFKPLNSTLSYKLPADLDHFAITTKPEKFPAPLDYGWLGQPGVACFGTVLDGLKVVQLHLNNGLWDNQVLIKPDYLAKMHESQFEPQIAEARAQGRKPDHEFTGLGIGLRGDTERSWSGFGKVAGPAAFGHPGIGTVMAVGDPDRDVGIMFLVTDEPKGVVEVRNGVTDLVMAAVMDR
jgi:CubicO group peptidase (beta-lactamase class C family)